MIIVLRGNIDQQKKIASVLNRRSAFLKYAYEKPLIDGTSCLFALSYEDFKVPESKTKWDLSVSDIQDRVKAFTSALVPNYLDKYFKIWHDKRKEKSVVIIGIPDDSTIQGISISVDGVDEADYALKLTTNDEILKEVETIMQVISLKKLKKQ